MPDYGSALTDKVISATEKKVRKVYEQAAKELQQKVSEHTRKFAKKQKEMLAKLKSGEITKSAYDSWMKGQVFIGKQWENKLDQAVKTMQDANAEAVQIVNAGRLNVFAENYNYASYELEKRLNGAVSFNLYSTESVARLIKEKPKMLPEWRVDEPKDYLWNRQKVENVITQGIIQGKRLNEITADMTNVLCTGNENKMQTFARTAMTGAQNAGRQEQMEDAQDEGIKLKKRWVATLDNRTREWHQDLDGQEVPVDDPFTVNVDGSEEEIMYPGDPNAEPCLVYNCRCTMIQVFEGIKRESVRRAYYEEGEEGYEEGKRNSYEVKDMTYKEWKEWKEGQGNTESTIEEQPQYYESVAKEVQYGELFTDKQVEETERTLSQLADEYPLETPLDFVGDARILYDDIPMDADHLDIASDPDLEKKYGGIGAQYHVDAEGRRTIAVFNESLGTESLADDFAARSALREKYGETAMLADKKLCLDSVSETVEGTIMHEYAHALADDAGIFSHSTEEGRSFNEWLYDFWKNNNDQVRLISRYAAQHPQEMLSESFVQIHDTEHTDTIAYNMAKKVWDEFTAFTRRTGRWAK